MIYRGTGVGKTFLINLYSPTRAAQSAYVPRSHCALQRIVSPPLPSGR